MLAAMLATLGVVSTTPGILLLHLVCRQHSTRKRMARQRELTLLWSNTYISKKFENS